MTKVFIDGSPGARRDSRGTICIHINGEYIIQETQFHGEKPTSNQAEFNALIRALSILKERNIKSDIIIYSDSLLLVNTTNGRWKAKHHNIKYICKVTQDLMKEFQNIKLYWINRDKNLAGIKLDSLAQKWCEYPINDFFEKRLSYGHK